MKEENTNKNADWKEVIIMNKRKREFENGWMKRSITERMAEVTKK